MHQNIFNYKNTGLSPRYLEQKKQQQSYKVWGRFTILHSLYIKDGLAPVWNVTPAPIQAFLWRRINKYQWLNTLWNRGTRRSDLSFSHGFVLEAEYTVENGGGM